ncbi:MAG: hypothetical protein H7249_17960 [Chitinophagaceae bacterium]|nr:hypothetical protein [Oligoflexus sp.]
MQASMRVIGLLKPLMIAFSILCCAPQGYSEGQKAADSRDLELHPHMQIAYQNLVKILNATARDTDSRSPAERSKIEAHLKALADEATIIHRMVLSGDKGHEFLSEELQRSSGLAYSRYSAGFREQAKFHISEVVNACFGCHTSRESSHDSSFTASFSKDLELESFDSLARARFLTLSRRFEDSASEYERILKSNNINADEMINFDPVVEYLILTLRVKNDQRRALKTLEAMQKNTYPEVIKQDLEAWSKALRAVPLADNHGNGLERGRALIALAKGQMEFPKDRSGMVQYVLASKYIQEFLRTENLTDLDKAQGYYELGGCELLLSTPYSADEANIYFAETIRLSPKTPLSKKAFTRYEENLVNGYSGSSGYHLPEDEAKKLNELRKISF